MCVALDAKTNQNNNNGIEREKSTNKGVRITSTISAQLLFGPDQQNGVVSVGWLGWLLCCCTCELGDAVVVVVRCAVRGHHQAGRLAEHSQKWFIIKIENAAKRRSGGLCVCVVAWSRHSGRSLPGLCSHYEIQQ